MTTSTELLALADKVEGWGIVFGGKQSPNAVKVQVSADDRALIVAALRTAARSDDRIAFEGYRSGNIGPQDGDSIFADATRDDEAMRKVIARAIDPDAWSAMDRGFPPAAKAGVDASLVIADRVLVALQPALERALEPVGWGGHLDREP